MATEADKPNTAVVFTALIVGAAAMVAGSAGLVALARGEMSEQGAGMGTYADLGSIKKLRAEQGAKLVAGKTSITKARASVLAAIKANPQSASPETPVVPAATASASSDSSVLPENEGGAGGVATDEQATGVAGIAATGGAGGAPSSVSKDSAVSGAAPVAPAAPQPSLAPGLKLKAKPAGKAVQPAPASLPKGQGAH